MKTITTILIMAISSIAFAQNCQWAQREGSSTDDYGRDIVADSDGYTYSVGDIKGTAATGCGNISSAGSYDIFVQKRDKDGNCIWAFTEGSTGSDAAHGVALDNTGHIYVTGRFSGTVQFPCDTITSNGNLDMFLAKYDTAGTCIWARHLGGVPQSLFWGEYGNQVTVDVNGDVLVFAHTNFKSVIFKYDAAGNYLWEQEISGNGTIFPHGIVTDSNGNVFVALENLSGNTTYFDCDTLSGTSNITGHVAKYSSSGSCMWANNLGINNTPLTTRAYDIGIDATNNLYVLGHVQLNADFGCGNTITQGGLDLFIKKIDNNGNCLWVERTGGANHETPQGIEILDSSIFITGYFSGTSYFPNDTLYSVGNFTSGFVAKWDTAGNGHWANEAGNGNNHCQMTRVSTDQYGNAYITGWALANPVTFQCASLAGASYDATFARYSPPCQAPTAMFGADSVCFGNTTTFTDESNPGSAPLVSWGWDFDGDTVADATGSSAINTYTSAGTHNVILLVENDCGDRDTIEKQIVVHALPVADLGADTAGCFGDVITLDAGIFSSYLWEDNTTNQTLNVASTDTVWVQVVDTNGCQDVDSVIVTIHPLPVPNLGSDTMICDDETIILNPGSFTDYEWQDASTASTYNVDGNTLGVGTYTFFVTVTDVNGCQNIDSIEVEVEVCSGISEAIKHVKVTAFPNPFNNNVTIEIDGLSKGKIKIYNLLGEVVWQNAITKSTTTINGREILSGIYLMKVFDEYSNIQFVTKLVAQ